MSNEVNIQPYLDALKESSHRASSVGGDYTHLALLRLYREYGEESVDQALKNHWEKQS